MSGICTHLVDFHVAELVEANDADVHEQRRDYGLEHTKRGGHSQVGRTAQRHERDGDDAQLQEAARPAAQNEAPATSKRVAPTHHRPNHGVRPREAYERLAKVQHRFERSGPASAQRAGAALRVCSAARQNKPAAKARSRTGCRQTTSQARRRWRKLWTCGPAAFGCRGDGIVAPIGQHTNS